METLAFDIHQLLQFVMSRCTTDTAHVIQKSTSTNNLLPGDDRMVEKTFKHPIIMKLSDKIAFLGVVSALRMVPFTRVLHLTFLSTIVKVDELDVVLGNENIGAADVTMHEAAIMNDA